MGVNCGVIIVDQYYKKYRKELSYLNGSVNFV